MDDNNSTAGRAPGDELPQQILQEQDGPLSPPKTQLDTSTTSSPFVISPSNEGETSPIKVKKKGRFTVKTTTTEGEDINYALPRAKELISTQPLTVKATVMAKLRPRPTILPSDKPHNARIENYDTIGLNVATAPVQNQTLPDEPRRHSHESLKSYDSYISDDSSSSDGLDPYSNDELSPDRHGTELETSPDINMTYSPEHPHFADRLSNLSPGKQSHVASDETATAAQNISHLYEDAVHLIGRNSNGSLPNFEYKSSSLPTFLGDEQIQFNINNLLSKDQLELLPLTQQQRRSSSTHKRSVRPPTLKMRCNSEPLFSSKSSGNVEANNLNIANYSVEGDGNKWATYSSSGVYASDNSESIDEDLPARMSTPLSLPEDEMIPSGRKVPIHIDSNTPTPTHAGGARHFYSNQESAQKVAEMQATVPLAHRPYLDYDEALTPQGSSNTNTPISTGTGCYTDEDDRDHMYWKSNTASFPDLATDNLHPSRWAMLFYLSLLNLLSGWTCFSLAPVATMLKGDVDAESLVSFFLLASAVATFCAPSTISCLGVRRTVMFGAILLIVGLNVCCASSDFGEGLHVGFIIVGLGQPLYQITTIFVVTAWFPSSEHETMLRTVLHSNNLGVLFSFLSGTFLVSSESDIITYFQCIILIASILFIAMAFHFKEVPPTPIRQTNTVFKDADHTFLQQLSGEPDDVALEFQDTNESTGIISTDLSKVYIEQLKSVAGHRNNFSYGSNNFSYGSSMEPSSPFPNLQGSFTSLGHHGEREVLVPQQDAETAHNEKTIIRNDQVLTLMKTYFSKEGSIRCSIAFVTSGIVANSLITFMSYLIGTSGSSKILLGAVGSAFQLFIMISPFIVDKWANPSHRHSLLAASLLAGVVALMMCMIAMEWESSAGLISSLLAVALILGSLQTLSIGRGIEISQMSESSVLVVFQLLSNTVSSMAIPLFRSFQADSIAKSAPEFSLPFIFLIAMNMFAAACFFGGNRTSSSNLQHQSERYPFLLTRRTYTM